MSKGSSKKRLFVVFHGKDYDKIAFLEVHQKVIKMYLHIGNNVSLRTCDIIAILKGQITFPDRKTVTTAMPKGKKVRASVLTDDAVYWSTINSATLFMRSDINNFLDDIK